jgi:hypothetical protein
MVRRIYQLKTTNFLAEPGEKKKLRGSSRERLFVWTKLEWIGLVREICISLHIIVKIMAIKENLEIF